MQNILFIHARPNFDISFCQFVRKYVPLFAQLPKPTEHIASFYFEDKLFYLACKNFSINENLIWTKSLWYQRASTFLRTFRENNYKPLQTFEFPVPHSASQTRTNECVLLLLLMERIAFLDSMPSDTFQIIIAEIFNHFCLQPNAVDLLIQISVNCQHRDISKIQSILNFDKLPSILQEHLSAQVTASSENSLSSSLIKIYNEGIPENERTYRPIEFAATILFIDSIFTPEEFSRYWAQLKFFNNLIILNDGQEIIKQTPFSNKNCRVQKIRCWVFKPILKVDAFEAKLSSGVIILLTSDDSSILAYEIGQNQRLKILNFNGLAGAEVR